MAKKKILIIEDEKRMANLLSAACVREGFTVLRAQDGKEGLQVAIAERPDIILLDVMLPGMDGIGMLHLLRKHDEWGQEVPVIFLSNLSPDDSLIHDLMREEPSFYFIKANTSLEQILAKIKMTVGA